MNIHCTRVYIKKICNLPQFMHGSRYNLLGCKKKLDMRMNIYTMFKLTTKIDAPFYIWFTNAIISVQIDECTSYEFESSKPPLCWIRHVFYFVASNLECIHVSDKCIKCFTLTTWSALINVYIWIAKAMHFLYFIPLSLYGSVIWNKHMHMLDFNRVWVSDRPIFVYTQIAKFMISSKNNNAIYIFI